MVKLGKLLKQPPQAEWFGFFFGASFMKIMIIAKGKSRNSTPPGLHENQLVIVEPPCRSTGGTTWHGHVFCSTVKMHVLRPSSWQDDRSGTPKIHQQKKLRYILAFCWTLPIFRCHFSMISQLPSFLGPTHTIQTPGKMDQSWSIFPLLFLPSMTFREILISWLMT